MCPENLFPMNRRDFLRLGGAGLAGAVLLGTTSGRVLARERTSLKAEFGLAAAKYKVPKELLLAMGYVNTLWEMPPPEVSDYEPGDLHGRGAYGIMQLMQNPSRDTLGRAASLTGLSEEELKTERAANVLGGAAVLSDIQGKRKPSELDGWHEAVAAYGGIELYATEVFETLKNGASATLSTGESLRLAPQEVEVPRLYTAQAKADYGPATWYGAYWNGAYKCSNSINFCQSNRGAAKIGYIVVHVGEGSFSQIISWFNDRRAGVSAHYVVGRKGGIGQCVRNEDIAYHAGNWWYNVHSIGIEHAGYGNRPKKWFTDRMYNSSAKLAAHLSRRYGIPVDARHIIPHRKVSATACPGKFNLRRYRNLIRHYR